LVPRKLVDCTQGDDSAGAKVFCFFFSKKKAFLPVHSTGVTRAFADALTAELPGLRRFAVALCGDAALADDLVQDCIERALTGAHALRDAGRLGPWLRAVVRNLFIDEVRRRKIRGTGVDMQDMADDIALSVPASGGAARDVLAAAARLSEEHRHILILAGVEELSYREMSAELAVPVGTVMSRLARARAALRALLDPRERPA
jgi:RNA polymerase sigma-70 factor (ECF subfamily)